ncbi:hypothetical protein [Agromyces humatus]|uniref:Uncharacterized protein n=1 Tax=Agromyces humatus TaxID=279573 RepID=A0ABN2KYT0_9MICO|nr:hypothetical protein [Agromyces humatus]
MNKTELMTIIRAHVDACEEVASLIVADIHTAHGVSAQSLEAAKARRAATYSALLGAVAHLPIPVAGDER